MTADGERLLAWAQDLYTDHLGSASARDPHVQGCLRKVRASLAAVPGDESLAVALVYLHDLGFSEEARVTGFSTLDGARFVKQRGGCERVVDLLAHQFIGSLEADLRGLGEFYREFGSDEASPVRDLLWSACMTTDTDGGDITVARRCENWWWRYADTVEWLGRYLEQAQGELEGAVDRTRLRLEKS